MSKLKDLRVKRGLSVKQLSGITQISISHIYQMERGEKQPSLKTLLLLSGALQVDPIDLLAYI